MYWHMVAYLGLSFFGFSDLTNQIEVQTTIGKGKIEKIILNVSEKSLDYPIITLEIYMYLLFIFYIE